MSSGKLIQHFQNPKPRFQVLNKSLANKYRPVYKILNLIILSLTGLMSIFLMHQVKKKYFGIQEKDSNSKNTHSLVFEVDGTG